MRALMIVDDEEGPRQALEILFEDDYTILHADSGFKAIDLATLQTVDAAIVDIRMPGLSGIETLGQLKKIDPAMEVIILTGYETLETARQALRLGAFDYLTKPFDIGTIRQAVATAMERRQQSEKIRGSHQKLLQLQEAIQNQALREEMARTRGEIYASILHDINGPLTIIYGLLDMVNQSIRWSPHLEGESLETLKERLYRVTLQINNCVNISRRYLGFLRESPEANATARVNQAFNDLRQLLKSHSEAKASDLVIHPIPSDVSARINGTDLLQILLNLATNALKCSPHRHQVEISGRCLSEPLDLSKIVDGPTDRFVNREGFSNTLPLVALSVRDTGPGIPPETLGKVFDAYFTTKPVGQGTGLGLSIVKRLVEQAKGGIHLHTMVGRGTEFTVYLPAWESNADPQPSNR